MGRMNPHEVSEADWTDEVAGDEPLEPSGEGATLAETGDEASLRDDDCDERLAADEVARRADAEGKGTGGSW